MKLLIVEDDRLIREGLRDILENEGYQCTLAANGVDALRRFNQDKPDLVLLDIMMPDKDGYAVCREIRNLDLNTAIIFISAKSEEIDRVLGLELGADDYISKPFGKHEVIARVRAVTRRYRVSMMSDKSAEDVPFEMADLIVHPRELRAIRGTESIDLSVRDCKILGLLFRQKNSVVTREQLFDAAWGLHYMPNSRTLDQHISTLRKRIEKDPRHPDIIKTVHGVGYRYDTR